jgi:hypothetical protein
MHFLGLLAWHEGPERSARGQINAGMRTSLVLMRMYTLRSVEIFGLSPARDGECALGRKLSPCYD